MENEQQAVEWYEHKKEYMKEWRKKNKDALNEKARQAYNAKKEAIQQRRRELYQLNKDKKQQYYNDNKERILSLRQKNRKRTKNNHLQSRYGISVEDFEKMLVEQQNKCYICYIDVQETIKKRLCIDHDHDSGKIRKLLCTKCNTALGLVAENIQILENMITYISEHKNE